MIATDILALREVEHGELVLDTGLTYDGIAPVRVHVVKRERKFSVSDEGGAVEAAQLRRQPVFPRQIAVGRGRSVNVSRRGVVSLPGLASSSDEWLAGLPQLVAEGSLALYEALLDLE